MKNIVFTTIGPWMLKGEQILVCGSCRSLGEWDPEKALPMEVSQGIVWKAEIDGEALPYGFEYKYIKVTADGEVEWEEGLNRTNPFEVTETRFPEQHPRYAGTAVPVFSLKSSQSAGIGDFADIKRLVEWAVLTGQGVVQLLPVNDTTSTKTWRDSYPYGAISIMALNPVYLSLKELGPLVDVKHRNAFKKEAEALNALPQVDYEKVFDLKMRYAREFFEQDGGETLRSRPFKDFLKAGREWLLPYAAFSVLRDRYGTADFSRWKKHSEYDAAAVEKMYRSSSTGREMDFYIFLQYHLDAQLRAAHDHARMNGIALKGDIPIGVARFSVETWSEPQYFNLGEQAGAPPDAFASDGQNWSFPTYNWEKMAEDGYSWWKRRFKRMEEHFDAYRIDHILGFFRIWEIPVGYASGLMGHFSPALPFSEDEMRERGFSFSRERHAMPYVDGDPTEVLFVEDPEKKGSYHPRIAAQFTRSYADLQQWEKDAYNRLYDDFFYRRNNEFWRDQALKKLPELISSTEMLACAEDLGMVPDCVPEVLAKLNILSLEVQRMPKNPSECLGNPSSYPYMSVCTTGSHDTASLREWWSETHGGVPCDAGVTGWIVAEHLASPSMLAVLPLQDWLSLDGNLCCEDPADERINVPSDPDHYWRYRMFIPLEQLLEEDEFNLRVRRMIRESGRLV